MLLLMAKNKAEDLGRWNKLESTPLQTYYFNLDEFSKASVPWAAQIQWLRVKKRRRDE